jgi:YD repeat-containing protein
MMSVLLRYSRMVGGLLLAAALVVGMATPGLAQTVTLVRPNASGRKVCGVRRIDTTLTPAPPGYAWDRLEINVTDANNVVEIGNAALLPGGTSACYECITTPHALGTCTIVAKGYLKNLATGSISAPYVSPSLTATLEETCDARQATREEIRCACARDTMPTSSLTSPLSGAQMFAVPLASWDFKGESYGFALTYNSHVLYDPQAPVAGFSGIGERNGYGQGGGRWSHSFDQWIDRYIDENGTLYAVWHTGGSAISFKWTGTAWDSEESFLKLESGGGSVTSPTFYRNGTAKTLSVNEGWFRITDGDGTKYDFNYRPAAGQQHLVWLTSEGTALVHYLLTRIQDRFSRSVNLQWSTSGDPRVTRVWSATRDAVGPGVRLAYRSGLLSSVTDERGRVHTLTHSPVADERGMSRQQLTQVRVLGPGSITNPPNWVWSFSYRDTSNPPFAYGGGFTGDLVTQKTEPDGRITHYEYEGVALTGVGKDRYREVDYDGRVARIAWVDSEAPAGERVITRAKESATAVLMTYPGGVGIRYGYNSEQDLTGVTDVATGRVWSATFDARHNLTETRTPVEASGQPLVQNVHTYSGAQITETLVKMRRDDGTLGDRLRVKLNALNLPWEITALKETGSLLNDQVTRLEYDFSTPPAVTLGRLTKMIEDYRTGGFNLTTNLAYDLSEGAWGQPTAITGPEGATSSFAYHKDRGWLLAASSPANLTPNSDSSDLAASISTIAYNIDGMPEVVTDPLGHPTAISYTAEAAGSPNTKITFTHADGNYAQVTVDPAGRPLIAQDENGIKTLWTYTGSGDVKTITRAYNTADQTVTTFYYDERGDLSWLVTPKGTGVRFEYFRYGQDGKLVTPPVYEGQVTRITYPDSTSELFGYYQTSPSRDVGELEWTRKADGSVITFLHDSRHRVKEIDYPGSQGGAAFAVTYQFDEFGRVTQSSKSDGAGTTTYQYDELNRIKQVVPPSPRKQLDFAYAIDATYKRWITTATVAGLGNYLYRDDTKGRLSEVVSPLLTSGANTWIFKYDKEGKEIERRHPNGTGGAGAREVSLYTTDGRDFLNKVELYDSANTLKDRLTYGHGPAGNLTSESDLGGRVHGFTYDNLYRLKQETHPDFGPAGSGQSIDYRYDANGNRTQKIVNGGTGTYGYTDYYGVDGRDRLWWVNRRNGEPTSGQTAPYTIYNYDANGRVSYRERRHDATTLRKLALIWDSDDRLKRVWQDDGTNVTSIFNGLYDEDGLRVQKTDSWTGTHNYSWGPGGIVHDTAGTSYTPGLHQQAGGTDRFFHSDWLGSTRYLSDSGGTGLPSALRYDAFGNRSATSGPDHPTDSR